MSDVGEGIKLASILAGWLLDPDGYQSWSRERKLQALHEAGILAIQEQNWPAYDRIVSELGRMRDAHP